MSEASKTTARPWEVAPTALHPLGLRGKWSGLYADGRMVAGGMAQADAALIVERVNGWEALVLRAELAERQALERARQRDELKAERDALREALEVIRDGADICRNTGATPAEAAFFSDRARAALGKGGVS